MPQHDFTIENQSGQGVRQDIAASLQALATNHSGANEPPVTFPFMTWADSGTDLFKLRNAANTGWVALFKLSTGEPQQVNLAGAIRLQGELNASLGSLPSNPEVGDMWRISVDGVLPDVGSVNASDSIIYTSAGWIHEDHTDAVTSVAGLMGAISSIQLLDTLLASTGSAGKIRASLQTVINDLTGVNAARLEGNSLSDLSALYAPASHVHDASEVENLVIGIRLGSEQAGPLTSKVYSAFNHVPAGSVITRFEGSKNVLGESYRCFYRQIIW